MTEIARRLTAGDFFYPGACFEGGGRITRDVIYYIVTNITVMGVTDEVL